MKYPITDEELHNMMGLDDRERTLVTEVLEKTVGFDDAQILVRSLRGYLAALLLENESDDTIEEELGDSAASFVDGWNYCLEYGMRK